MNQHSPHNEVVESIYAEDTALENGEFLNSHENAGIKRNDSNKKIFAFIFILGLLGVFLGFFQLFGHIKTPIDLLAQEGSKTLAFNTSPQEDIFSVLDADIDSDGISDSDEINTYFTSPYLEDSDSDGINDYDELQKGTDPNCIGGNCAVNSRAKQVASDDPINKADEDTQENIVVSAQYLRDALAKSGIDPSLFSSLSDEELMKEYSNALKEDVGSSSNNSGTDIVSMTPPQIREFLKTNGMDQSIIDSFSDEELKKILEETTLETKKPS